MPLDDEEKAREMMSQKELPVVKEDMEVPFDVLEERVKMWLDSWTKE